VSLRLRLSLLISLLLALVTLTAAAYALRSAREDVRAEVRSSADLAIHLLDSELRRSEASASAPRFGLAALGDVRHVRIEFRDAAGKVLESNRQADRIKEPSAPAWFAWLVDRGVPQWQDIRRSVDLGGISSGELVVLPDPSFEIDEVWSDARHLLALLGVLFLATNALVYWVVGRALRPVERILGGLAEIEQGHLETRLPEIDLPELAQMGRAFNRMMDTLQSSVTRNRQLAQKLLRVQEEERRTLAHELHDEIGQYLTAIHADAAAIANVAQSGPGAVRESADAIVNAVRAVMGMVRGMLQRLHPETLHSLGLEEAVRELVAGWRARNPGVDCRLELATPPEAVDGATGIAAYRVVQEALTNVARHARAERVEVRIDRIASTGHGMLNVCVKDDGVGAVSCPQPGYGLMGMRERVEALGGVLSINAGPGRGFTVSAMLPLAGVV